MSATMTTKQPTESKSELATPTPDPFWSISPFGLTVGRMLDDFWKRSWPEGENHLISPPLDVTDTNDALLVTAEVPGMTKDAIDITFENGVLTISGEKTSKSEEKNGNSYRMERRYGSFCRALSLPANVDADNIEADLEDGVLTIRLPKSENAKAKAVKIK